MDINVMSIVVAMKPIEGGFAHNAEKWGVAGLNVDGGRVKGESWGTRPKYRLTSKGIKGGAWANQDAPKQERLPGKVIDLGKGRFPANVIHDNSPAVLREFGKAGVRQKGAFPKTTNRTKNKSMSGDNYPRKRIQRIETNQGSASRYFQVCPPDLPTHSMDTDMIEDIQNEDNEIKANTVITGDCLDVMKRMPDNCVDTIITDPPYSLSSIKRRFAETSLNDDNLTGQAAKNGSHQYARLSRGFMGQKWDNEIAFNPEVWKEALRVAKPGAILLAFGGTRTYHRLACAIEDAGWEIRDCISYFNDGTQQKNAFLDSLDDEQLAAYLELHHPGWGMDWVYGSGFPKSHDISKAIDRAKGAEREVVGYQIAQGNAKEKGAAGHYANGINSIVGDKEIVKDGWNITAPTTPLAKTWSGYGTALKPAHEPIVMAMKPLDGTYAHNAEEWGVAGLNVDNSRVLTQDAAIPYSNPQEKDFVPNFRNKVYGKGLGGKNPNGYSKGRFPPNVISDGSDEVEREFAKAGVSVARPVRSENIRKSGSGKKIGLFGAGSIVQSGYYDKEISVSRFFAKCPPDSEPACFTYHAKAPRSERSTPGNNHPTQKPLSLVRYLCRLTKTPTGGLVLDPFAGSGTTAIACIAEGRDYILIEKEPDYANLCKRRIAEYNGEIIEEKEIEVNEKEIVKQMSLW